MSDTAVVRKSEIARSDDVYVRLRERSILSMMSEASARTLVDNARIVKLEPGGKIGRTETASELHIVLDGEIGLFSRDGKRTKLGSISKGRTIEMEALLGPAGPWRYEWIAEIPSVVFSVERTHFDTALSAQPELKEYLRRVTNFVEVQKFKNDLRFFGFNPAEVQRSVCALQFVRPKSADDLKRDGTHLCVVQGGEVDLIGNFADTPRQVGHYGPGDYLLLGQAAEIDAVATPGATVWVLSQKTWESIADKGRVGQYFMFVNPLATSMATLRKTHGASLPGIRKRIEEPEAETEALETEEAEEEEEEEEASDDESGDEEEEEEEEDELAAFECTKEELTALAGMKRPVVLQHDEMDCGAACLSMACRFYGRRVSVATLRNIVHVTRDGASVFALKKAADKIGFESTGAMAEYDHIQGFRVPFIALLQYHFVVVYRVTEKEVVVGDPARGLVTIAADDFVKEWSGVVLLMKETPRLREFPESEASFKKYLDVLDDSKRYLLEALLASLLVFFFGLATPLFMQLVFDKILVEQKQSLLDAIALAIIGITTASTITEWTRNYLITYISMRVDAKFSTLFLRHTLSLPLGFFAVRRVGDVTARLHEIARVREFVTGRSISIVINVFSAIVYSAILVMYRWELLAIVVVLMPIVIGFIQYLSPRLTNNLRELFKTHSKSASLAYEHFSAFETLKSINGLVAARWRWEEVLAKTLALTKRHIVLSAIIGSAGTMLSSVMNVTVLVVSCLLYLNQKLSLGQVVAVNALLSSITQPVFALVNEWTSFKSTGVSLERIDDVITSASEPVAAEAKTHKLRGEIEFKGVSFQYGSEMSPMVLQDVSLKIKAGETVAFVGRSGSGKTTLGYMVNLLYPPTGGKLFLDGVDATQIPLADVRNQVAMITQDNAVFSGSVLENLALGDANPSFQKAMSAASAADAHEFISKLQNGYSSLLGEGGSGLSGGQRQRLNVARAFYREPIILIMDEATSALDAVSEQRIMASMKKWGKKRTTIIIAHRLNTVMAADRIFVLDEGRLAESGSHQELIRAQGFYYQLFKKQLSIS